MPSDPGDGPVRVTVVRQPSPHPGLLHIEDRERVHPSFLHFLDALLRFHKRDFTVREFQEHTKAKYPASVYRFFRHARKMGLVEVVGKVRSPSYFGPDGSVVPTGKDAQLWRRVYRLEREPYRPLPGEIP